MVGVSQPVPAAAVWNFPDAAVLLLRTASHFLLLAIPSLALCAYAIWRGVRDLVAITLIALIGLALPGYAVFWAYLWSSSLGHAVSFLIPVGATGFMVFLLRRIGPFGRSLLKPLLVPAALVFLASLWILSGGFAYGGMRAPLITPLTRFSHPLPPDNMIPYLFAEGVRFAHVPKPLLGIWLSSDRPPLQTAIALSQYPFLPQPRDLGYTTLAVLLQSTWIVALWILLVAFDIDRRAIRLALATVLFSGFTLINSFFVWPKLLAATYIVALAALLLVDKYSVQLGRSKFRCVIGGTLMAFGMLAHGGSAFAIAGLFITCLLLRKRVPPRSWALLLLTCALLYLPWALYQRFYDPPGNQLLKLHLAGVDQVENHGLLEDVETAYGKLSVRQWYENKKQNSTWAVGYQSEYWPNVEALFTSLLAGQRTAENRAAAEIRSQSFFHFSSNLGFLIAGPFFLIAGIRKRYRTQEWKVSGRLWLFVACTFVPWCLVLFNPASTSVHQGTYVAVLAATTGSVLALWSVSPSLAYAVSGAQILQFILIYGVFMRDSSGNALVAGTAHLGTLALFFVTFLLSWYAITQLGRESTDF